MKERKGNKGDVHELRYLRIYRYLEAKIIQGEKRETVDHHNEKRIVKRKDSEGITRIHGDSS